MSFSLALTDSERNQNECSLVLASVDCKTSQMARGSYKLNFCSNE